MSLPSQEFRATITGRITDASGAAVPNVAVQELNLETNERAVAVADNMWTILAVGLFNSIMFPTIFSLGEVELGPLTGNASGLLNMAIAADSPAPAVTLSPP